MNISKEELEIKILRSIDTFYTHPFTEGEKYRGHTAYHYLIRDFRLFKNLNGDLTYFKNDFLPKMLEVKNLTEDQEDFICDLIQVLNNGNHPSCNVD